MTWSEIVILANDLSILDQKINRRKKRLSKLYDLLGHEKFNNRFLRADEHLGFLLKRESVLKEEFRRGLHNLIEGSEENESDDQKN